MSHVKSNRLMRAHSGPLVAPSEAARLIILPGAHDASGESLIGLATGHPRRPIIRMFRTMAEALAAKAAMRAQGGAA